MRNPWLDLPHDTPFVLPDDMAVVEAFNTTAKDAGHIHGELLPEPFVGDPQAPIVLLGLNPGFSPKDVTHHSDPTFANLLRMNLQHSPAAFPFYLLSPQISAPGQKWCERRLARLLEVAPRETVAKKLLTVEYFPYHSHQFVHHRLRVASQAYGFFLVREAVRRGALIILTRSRRLWFSSVPELATYGRLFTLRSVQNTIISRKNCPEGFDEVLTALDVPAGEMRGLFKAMSD
jgi:hypothetical protein